MKLLKISAIFYLTVCNPLRSEDYSKETTKSKFDWWVSENPIDFNGVYRSIDFDKTLEEYFYLKFYIKEKSDVVMFSIVRIHIPVIAHKPEYEISDGIFNATKDAIEISYKNNKIFPIKFKATNSKEFTYAIKVGDNIYAKEP